MLLISFLASPLPSFLLPLLICFLVLLPTPCWTPSSSLLLLRFPLVLFINSLAFLLCRYSFIFIFLLSLLHFFYLIPQFLRRHPSFTPIPFSVRFVHILLLRHHLLFLTFSPVLSTLSLIPSSSFSSANIYSISCSFYSSAHSSPSFFSSYFFCFVLHCFLTFLLLLLLYLLFILFSHSFLTIILYYCSISCSFTNSLTFLSLLLLFLLFFFIIYAFFLFLLLHLLLVLLLFSIIILYLLLLPHHLFFHSYSLSSSFYFSSSSSASSSTSSHLSSPPLSSRLGIIPARLPTHRQRHHTAS